MRVQVVVVVLASLCLAACSSQNAALREARAALKYPGGRACAQGLRDLATLGPQAKPALPEIIAILKLPRDQGDNNELMTLATTVVANIGPAAVPALLRELKTDDEFTRLIIARAIAEAQPPANQAIPGLIDAMRNTHDRDWKGAYSIPLTRIGEGAVPALARLLVDKGADLDSRCVGAQALVGIGSAEAARVLLVAAEAPDSEVRMAVVLALDDSFRMSTPLSVDTVVRALFRKTHDPDKRVRLAAVGSLVRCSDDPRMRSHGRFTPLRQEVLDSLRALEGDPDPDIRRALSN